MVRVRIALSATNPCHLYELARELDARGALAAYHSGYPGWRLKPPAGFPLRAHPFRTLVTYGLNRLPSALRPDMFGVFRWQDEGFDRAVARTLERADEVHAMPGQARHTFRRAAELGMRKILNHASGPVWKQNELVAEEYSRVGIRPPSRHPLMAEVERIHRTEYELADVHCVSSTVVRAQLLEEGIAENRIWLIPYGADERVFFPSRCVARGEGKGFRMVYAGQLVLRKGLKTLLDALEMLGGTKECASLKVRLDCYGQESAETESDFARYAGAIPVGRHGVVRRESLAEIFRSSDVLVLPSWEEAFGLVVPQALACGCPCVVSDRVGAKDLIRHRENGSIFRVGDAESLAEELRWWMANGRRVGREHLAWRWEDAVSLLLKLSVRGA